MYVMKGTSRREAALIGLFWYPIIAQVIVGALAQNAAPQVFDVLKSGAIASGKPQMDDYGEDENSLAFIQTWVKACKHPGPAKVLVPPGKYVVGQVIFSGPCTRDTPVVEVQGQILANPDHSVYPSPEWFSFENVDGVVLRGVNGSSFDGQGKSSYAINDCLRNPGCSPLPSTIKFHKANNSVVEGVKSIDSMFFHVWVQDSTNVTVQNVHLQAPEGSPNTDGVRIAGSKLVKVVDSVIQTGAECVSAGPGSSNVSVTGVTCGTGLGIGVTGLGRNKGELAVQGVNVSNCSFNQSQNGVVLNSWPSLWENEASGIVFQNLFMEKVRNPLVIDQKQASEPSHVKIKDVTFRNISGSSSTNLVISFNCSKLFPCVGIQVIDVNVKAAVPGSAASCSNAKVKFDGNNNGLAC